MCARSVGAWRHAVEPLLRAGLNHDFLVVRPHQHDLATEAIRQRMGKIVNPVSFGPQIG